MEDAFGDPNLVSDAHNSLSVATPPLPLESDNQSGIPVSDYLDTDNDLEKELHEAYEGLPSIYETNNGDDERSSNISRNEMNKVEPRTSSNSLFSPINFVVNFAATQFTALKNAVSNRLDINHSLAEDSHESNDSSSSKIIMASLASPETSSSEKTFTTQDEILDEVGVSADENGICSPVVNLYFEKKLGLRDDSFMRGSAEHIYEEAIKEKLHQVDLIHQGKDGLHAVFVDHNIPYKTKQVKASESESGEKVKDLLKDYDQVLITYPTVRKDGERDRHQIYVEKIDDTQCSRFDVNKKGGVEEMPCSMFYQKLAKKIAKAHDDNDDEEVIIAGIKK
ncbi:hypothetical protein [Fluoribacter gormanii]|uniref:Uncharacterized protein n=1 Tax=Fluoribacter gormanii TaxID=464 RepID=A0A377GJL1_9GAMM|nr:hypothetical protein [Fluoribacter gormanii]KTD00859.1 hypothetical protein Lgor_2776 [Fluoribacter gormanii]SIQ80443.1 hypothetical protein SAMN05421777_103116 [Fluoribacter gormanii]STO25006.1 Uncharacterised protein [Fluoribacter gormanii]